MNPRLPHCIEAELISALGKGTNLDVAAADQSKPSATRTARPIHPMRCIFIPHLGKIGLAYFSPSECEVAYPSRGINGGSNQRARSGVGRASRRRSLCARASERRSLHRASLREAEFAISLIWVTPHLGCDNLT